MRLSVIKPNTTAYVTNLMHTRNPIQGLLLSIFASLFCQLSASATLPESVERALNESNISSDNISVVITPVKHLAFSTPKSNSKVKQHSFINVLEPVKISDNNIQNFKDKPVTEETTESVENDATIPSATQFNNDTTQNNDSIYNNNDVDQINSLANELDYSSNQQAQPLSLPIRHLPDIPRTPASTMKLIPTFIALDMMGADFVWLTKVYHTGLIFGNTLYGDLIIKGSGDPKLTSQRLTMLLAKINKAGIRHIKGDIVLDTSVFRNVGKDPATFDNQPLKPYNASPDGLLINFSSIKMTAAPLLNSEHEQLARIFYSNKLAGYELPNYVPMSEGPCSSVVNSLAPMWTQNALKFSSSMPKSCDTRTFYLAYPDVKDFAKRTIKYKWLQMGNTLSGSVISTEHPRKTEFSTYLDMSEDTLPNQKPQISVLTSSLFPFITYKSLPLSNQIHDINHYSNNVMTEQLTLSLPIFNLIGTANHSSTDITQTEADYLTQPSNQYNTTTNYSDYAQAVATIDQWWQSKLTTPPPYMTNGSGLCRDCTVTADNLAELLEYAYHHPNFDIYADSLGIAGISGTIKQHADRMPNSAAIGRAWIKTGTLDNVTAMAGYVNGQSGQDYVVVSIINSPEKLNTNQARYALDTLLDWTAKH